MNVGVCHMVWTWPLQHCQVGVERSLPSFGSYKIFCSIPLLLLGTIKKHFQVKRKSIRRQCPDHTICLLSFSIEEIPYPSIEEKYLSKISIGYFHANRYEVLLNS